MGILYKNDYKKEDMEIHISTRGIKADSRADLKEMYIK